MSKWGTQKIIEVDRAHVWHPYTSRRGGIPQVPVDETDGVYLRLSDGRTVIDGMSSWWAACHGHGHPDLKAAALRQIDRMSHVMFGGLTHQPAVELAQRLIAFANQPAPAGAQQATAPAATTPAAPAAPAASVTEPACGSVPREVRGEPLTSVFFSDSGSVSIEVSLKMALQAQRGLGNPTRDRFLTWRRGYHGDTQGPMSLCDPVTGMHALWAGTLTQQVFLPAPPVRGATAAERSSYLDTVASTIAERNRGDHGIAAIVVEPVVQGAGGVRFHDHELVAGLREVCDRTGTLLILDEIATGFGRTGAPLVSIAAGIRPDILCLGKALTGGFMTFAATLANDRVATAIDSPAGGGGLMHGPTYTGNPLAAAVALASLNLIESGYWVPRVDRIGAILERKLAPLRDHPDVADVRVLGAIGVVEKHADVDWVRATTTLLDHGVWLRPFGRVMYALPPFISTDREVEQIADAMLAEVRGA